MCKPTDRAFEQRLFRKVIDWLSREICFEKVGWNLKSKHFENLFRLDSHSQTFKRIFARKDKSFGQTITSGEFEIHGIFDKFYRIEFRSENFDFTCWKFCRKFFENLEKADFMLKQEFAGRKIMFIPKIPKEWQEITKIRLDIRQNLYLADIKVKRNKKPAHNKRFGFLRPVQENFWFSCIFYYPKLIGYWQQYAIVFT